MLNPRVGLIDVMSSPLIFFRIVVLPALSSPLQSNVEAHLPSPERCHLQKQYPDFLLFLTTFSDDSEQSHGDCGAVIACGRLCMYCVEDSSVGQT